MSLYLNADKVILFGGTFDPIHNGHLHIAAKLHATFHSKITFMPTGIPAYKTKPKAHDKQRLAMLNLAISGNVNYQIDTREINTKCYCYTYKTLQQLRTEIGAKTPLYFLIGSDSLVTLDTWEYWEGLLGLTNFVVAWRQGYSTDNITSPALKHIFMQKKTTNFTDLTASSGRFYILDFTPENISSTMIRSLVSNREEVTHLIPRSVADYIKKQQLYLA